MLDSRDTQPGQAGQAGQTGLVRSRTLGASEFAADEVELPCFQTGSYRTVVTACNDKALPLLPGMMRHTPCWI